MSNFVLLVYHQNYNTNFNLASASTNISDFNTNKITITPSIIQAITYIIITTTVNANETIITTATIRISNSEVNLIIPCNSIIIILS